MGVIQTTIGIVTLIIFVIIVVSVIVIAEKIIGNTEETEQGQRNER